MALPPFDYFVHRAVCQRKQQERLDKIGNLNARNRDLTSKAEQVDPRTRGPIEDIVFGVQNKKIDPHQVLEFYGGGAVKAHKATNRLTEVMIPEAHEWINSGKINLKGPLAE